MMQAAAAGAASKLAPTGKIGNYAKSFVIIVVVVAVLALGFFVVKRIFGGLDAFLESIGLKDSEEDKARKAKLANATNNSNNAGSPWSPAFYKSAPPGTALPNLPKREALSKQIWNSVGAFYDDPEQAYGAIKQLSNQASVSYLCEFFNTKYERDLYNWLLTKFDTSEQQRVLVQIDEYVKSLPKY
jgi:hypothetical protein